MKTLREMMDLIESAQSSRPELRTWGNRATGETHYSVDGVEVSRDRYYQAWRADQKTQGNPDIKEQEVDEDQATAQKYAVRMNAQQLGSTNRTKYTWTGTASSDDQAREMAIAYADRHGFKNIVVKEISKKEQAVDEQATPEAVAKINSLFSR